MNAFLHFMFAIAGLTAALAVGVMCAVSLFVWLAGSTQRDSGEAWRHADKL